MKTPPWLLFPFVLLLMLLALLGLRESPDNLGPDSAKPGPVPAKLDLVEPILPVEKLPVNPVRPLAAGPISPATR